MNHKHDFYILRIPRQPGFAYIQSSIHDLEMPWLLSEGVKMGENFPENAISRFSKKWKGEQLNDFIANCFGYLLVSEKTSQILKQEPVEIEWLPIQLRNKSDKSIASPYQLAHVIGTVDCVDLSRSVFTRSATVPEEFLVLERLVLDLDRIPPKNTIFRIKEQPRTMIIRSDLLVKFHIAGVTGHALLELNSPILI